LGFDAGVGCFRFFGDCCRVVVGRVGLSGNVRACYEDWGGLILDPGSSHTLLTTKPAVVKTATGFRASPTSPPTHTQKTTPPTHVIYDNIYLQKQKKKQPTLASKPKHHVVTISPSTPTSHTASSCAQIPGENSDSRDQFPDFSGAQGLGTVLCLKLPVRYCR